MYKLYANTILFGIRDLNILRFGYPWGGGGGRDPGTKPQWLLRDNIFDRRYSINSYWLSPVVYCFNMISNLLAYDLNEIVLILLFTTKTKMFSEVKLF